METYTKVRKFEVNHFYHKQREESINKLELKTIDNPIIQLIVRLLDVMYCFTIQSCYGHFLYNNQRDTKNTEPLPDSDNNFDVEYRIAYIALCLENSNLGRSFLDRLQEIPAIDSEYIQFGCAEWFWKRNINSYVLQVEPERYKTKDIITVDYKEALYIEKIRNNFFQELEKVMTSI